MSWYALVVPPMRERAAVEVLQHYYEAFSPIEYVHRRTNLRAPNAKKIAIPRAIFPRYVFALDPDWYTIRRLEIPGTMTPIVSKVLGVNGRPSPISMQEVLNLMHVAEHGPPQTIPVSRGFAPGDIVIVGDGPFKGHKVKVTRSDRNSIAVLIDILGSMREVPVPIGMLEAA